VGARQFILLTGEPGVGKTTIIQRVLEQLDFAVSGFYTLEIREHEKRVGFKMVTVDGVERILAHIDIKSPHQIGRYGVDISALEFIISESIEKPIRQNRSIFLIDEIGPMEILSDRFRAIVRDLLERNVLVIGTIVKRKYLFADEVKAKSNVTLVYVLKGYQENAYHEMLEALWRAGFCQRKTG